MEELRRREGLEAADPSVRLMREIQASEGIGDLEEDFKAHLKDFKKDAET